MVCNARRPQVPTAVGRHLPTDPISFPGKNWHDTKKPFRPSAGLTSYAKRQEARKHQEAVKEREREMKEEREAERQVSDSRFLVLYYYYYSCLDFSPSRSVPLFHFLRG